MPISRTVEPRDIGVMPPRRRPAPAPEAEPELVAPDVAAEPEPDAPPEKPVKRGKK